MLFCEDELLVCTVGFAGRMPPCTRADNTCTTIGPAACSNQLADPAALDLLVGLPLALLKLQGNPIVSQTK